MNATAPDAVGAEIQRIVRAAAEMTGRAALAIEIAPQYVDVAVRAAVRRQGGNA